jgi:hypothetical protein
MKRRPEPNEVWHWKLENTEPCEAFTVLAWDLEHKDALIAGPSLERTHMNGFRVYDGYAFGLTIWHAADECPA